MPAAKLLSGIASGVYANHPVAPLVERRRASPRRHSLHAAALAGRVAAIEAQLVDGTCDGRVSQGRAVDKKTPLHMAVKSGVPLAVGALLEGAADVNAAASHGETPLHEAAAVPVEDRNLHIAWRLLDARASVDARTKSGATALHFAAHFGYGELCSFLVLRLADVGARDNAGYTPLEVAQLRRHDEAVLRLRELREVHFRLLPMWQAAVDTGAPGVPGCKVWVRVGAPPAEVCGRMGCATGSAWHTCAVRAPDGRWDAPTCVEDFRRAGEGVRVPHGSLRCPEQPWCRLNHHGLAGLRWEKQPNGWQVAYLPQGQALAEGLCALFDRRTHLRRASAVRLVCHEGWQSAFEAKVSELEGLWPLPLADEPEAVAALEKLGQMPEPGALPPYVDDLGETDPAKLFDRFPGELEEEFGELDGFCHTSFRLCWQGASGPLSEFLADAGALEGVGGFPVPVHVTPNADLAEGCEAGAGVLGQVEPSAAGSAVLMILATRFAYPFSRERSYGAHYRPSEGVLASARGQTLVPGYDTHCFARPGVDLLPGGGTERRQRAPRSRLLNTPRDVSFRPAFMPPYPADLADTGYTSTTRFRGEHEWVAMSPAQLLPIAVVDFVKL